CLKTQPATGETYPKSDLFNKAVYYIKQHVNRINWFGNDSIKKIKFRYSLSLKELIDWVSDPDHWIDIAVEVDDTSGSRPMAVAMFNQNQHV
ncbi:hypothetical protein ACKE2L_006129, partial [Klebsiella pneumoniae]